MTDCRPIKLDKLFIAHSKRVQNGNYSIDTQAITKEIISLHSGLAHRSMNVKNLSEEIGLQSLQSAILQSSGYRSRLVEIKLQLSRQRSTLETTTSSLRSYISHKYPNIFSPIKTKSERDNSKDDLLIDSYNLIQQLVNLESQIDIIITDVDKAAWSIKNLIDIQSLFRKDRF